MSTGVESLELNKFYHALTQDLRTTQLSEEEGGNLEEIFTQWAVDLLASAGETENARVAYDEKALGTKNQHKINGYSIADNYETIDVFITIFKGLETPQRVAKDELDTAVKRIINFIKKGLYKDYVNEIEESSPIFDFVHTLASSPDLKENLVRINAIIITDGFYPSEIQANQNLAGYPVFFRVVDINYLYNITEKSHIPIEIDFASDNFSVPCILSPTENEQYKSFLAIVPGPALATIYERYGSRLLEQNVRSFLQFTGKINKGIRKTILDEPHMFLAFNNGISATADEIEVSKAPDGKGLVIDKVKNFQIVNGGQTTASIYHTFKKDKKDISGVFVQLKLNVIKNKERFNEIVSQISEYANTQNKVSVADLSSNRPYHIELEKLSRSVWAPPQTGSSTQTRWFYERARGQYKNARINEGFTKAKQKAFDLKNPKGQMFTKEDLAKYINSYQEVSEGKKIVIGPHFVVRGNQKNYVQFINYNLEKKIDSIYYEDIIAKAILFRAAEKRYGVKPNSIGDMRYITVPYSIAYLGIKTGYQLDLYKIWRNQAVSEELKDVLFDLMTKVEGFIKNNAPGALYGEWAKKEDCWNSIKSQDFGVDLKALKGDLINPKTSIQRKRISEDEFEKQLVESQLENIKSVPSAVWHKIEEWGKETGKLKQQQLSVAYNLAGRVRNNSKISDIERTSGTEIISVVAENAPEILYEVEYVPTDKVSIATKEISLDLVKKIVQWDRKNKRLKTFEFVFMNELAEGKKTLTGRNVQVATWNFEKVKKYGFQE
jgi:hypothetical protein